ncbi:50S ribosomal protein L29 [Planctomycetota bacterium]|nr:50S ribosomal protein L29 [Planctomycetota bacterium]
MSINALKGLSNEELTGKLNELAGENFKQSFVTEAMTSVKGAEIRKRRREIARIRTVIDGRQALATAQEENKHIESLLAELGAPHTGGAAEMTRRTRLVKRQKEVKRTIRELGSLAV